jgi:protein-tyrosine phosphatase
MIDLHCHVLPRLDDGALDLRDSVAMARQAQEDGIETVCATPHIRHDHRVEIEEIAGRVRELQERLDEEGVPVRIATGGELAQTEADRLTDVELHTISLGGGGWLLLEPAPGPLGEELHELACRLHARGYGSIVAHPERHAGADFEECLRMLAGEGCLVQWTAQFVAQAAEGDLVLRLAEEGLLHLLGSDAHSSRAGRPVRLSEGFARLESVCSPARLRWMRELAPAAILVGQPLTPLP